MTTNNRKAGVRAALASAIVALAGTAVAAAPAVAAPMWITPAEDISDNAMSNFSAPVVAIGPNGDVAVLFELGSTLKLVTRPAGGTFAAAEDLTSAYSASTSKGIAVDAAGNVYAVWTEVGMTGSLVKAAVKTPGNPPVVSTLESTNTPDEPNIAVTPSGDAVAAWRLGGGGSGLRMARRPAGGSFGAPFTVFGSGTVAEQPTIDINSGGDAALGFRRRIGGGNFFCMALFQPAGSTSASAAVFDPGAGATDDDPRPGIGVDNSGNASLLCGRGGVIKVSNKASGSNTWSAISGASGTVDSTAGSANPRMAWNNSGQQAASWTTGSGTRLVGATRSGLDAFSAQEVGAPGMGITYSPGEVAIDPSGVGLMAYLRGGTLAGARTSGASWTATNNIATASGPSGQRVAVDDQGNGAVAFVQTNGTTNIRATGFDAAGPRLNDVVFPATAQAGEAFAYSVSPLDVWSAVGSTMWSFGEGSTANGAGGEFTYGSAGSFTATVTATDALGNSNSATRDITVEGDSDAPQTTITKTPRNRSRDRTPTYKFKANEPGSSFECARDGKAFKPCDSPETFRAKPGKHKFEVRAIDAAGNRDPSPDSDRFRILKKKR